MTVHDLVISGGSVVTPHGTTVTDVGIVGERIATIGPGLDGAVTIDATDRIVLPGAVDVHVHLTAGERRAGAFVDDFASGTRAAVAGGVTTVGQICFPSDADDPALERSLRRDRAAVESDALIDVLLHPAVIAPDSSTIGEIGTLRERGYRSLKMMINSMDRPGGAAIVEAIAAAGRAGLVSMLHCEDQAIIDHLTAGLIAAGQGATSNYPASRPAYTEVLAVERAIAIGRATGSPIYIVHVSSAGAVEAIRRAKSDGVVVFAETRPIYLYLTSAVHEAADGGKFAGMPPLRGDADVEALWRGLADGTIDTVASDHAPWLLADKTGAALDVETIPKGIAELDTFLPMLYTEGVQSGRITIERLVEVATEAPARIFGVGHLKGAIRPGLDADLAIIDPRESRSIDPGAWQSRSDYSVYEGRAPVGWPVAVVSRGRVVLDRGAVVGRPDGRSLLNDRIAEPSS